MTVGHRPVKVKICGLSRTEDIAAANRCLPDYIGFVFAPSKRQISPQTAFCLKQQLDPRIQAVGVFVNEDPCVIASICQSGIIDLIQLHGDETSDDIAYVKSISKVPVIKAIPIRDALPPLPQNADYLLFDTFSNVQRGGTGTPFPWNLLQGIQQPYFLAGGLHAGNIREALGQCSPYCVDVSSGVETASLKDPTKMVELMQLID